MVGTCNAVILVIGNDSTILPVYMLISRLFEYDCFNNHRNCLTVFVLPNTII